MRCLSATVRSGVSCRDKYWLPSAKQNRAFSFALHGWEAPAPWKIFPRACEGPPGVGGRGEWRGRGGEESRGRAAVVELVPRF